jgi:uncharacterized protein
MVQLTEIHLYWPTLPGELENFNILHIGDLHIRRFGRLEKMLMQAVEQPCDLLLCTGDLCHRVWLGNPIYQITGTEPTTMRKDGLLGGFWVPRLRQAREIYLRVVRNANARLGCFTVQGNHDLDKLMADLAQEGVRILSNEACQIALPTGGELNLMGLRCYGRLAVDIPAALLGCKPGLFTIAMSHYPELAEPLAAAGVDLILAGHTHGGQFCFPSGRPIVTHSRTGTKYFTGLAQINKTWLYVTRGLNGSIVPWRICCPPEITRVTLHQGAFEKTTLTSKPFST